MAEALKKQAQYLKENGFTEQQASALIFFQKDFIDNHLATKADVEIIRKDIEVIRKDIEVIRKDIEVVRAELKQDIEMVRADLKKDIEMVRAELKQDIEMVRKDLTIRLGSIMVGGIVILGMITQLSL